MTPYERFCASLHSAEVFDDVWQPIIFTLPVGSRGQFEAMCRAHHVAVTDTIESLMHEWMTCREQASTTRTVDEIPQAVQTELDAIGGDSWVLGAWVYYPWLHRLIHVLPAAAFQLVRGNRNRDKITLEEQRTLRQRKIGVVGLSVGHAAAVLLAREGIAGQLRLADFDHVELSNLNRLNTSLANLGLAKSVVAGRDIAEIDPYLDVRIFPEGITEQNMDDFLTGGGRLDLVVEECDTLWVKLLVRERARHHGIPVVMDTNDRGMLDVERFDQEPERPILHGMLGDCDSYKTRDMDAAQRTALFYDIVGGAEALSPRLRESLQRVGAGLVGIPQLASDVHLGAALVVDAARKILLGSALASGRYYVDLDDLLPE
jgi:molybdopterin/thiamine biosynthesis adenylyltransferase